jgi:hypothetical protein
MGHDDRVGAVAVEFLGFRLARDRAGWAAAFAFSKALGRIHHTLLCPPRTPCQEEAVN